MQPNAEPAQQLRVLCESIEAHAQRITLWLTPPVRRNDLRLEIETLNSLLTAFTCANEMMQQSLNCSDLNLRSERLRAAFNLLRWRGVSDRSDPLFQLRALSNQIIGQVLALREKAYRVIEQEVGTQLGDAVEVSCFGQPVKKLARAATA